MTGPAKVPTEWSKRLANALVERGIISAPSAEHALKEAGASGRPVAQILEGREEVDSRVLLEVLSALSSLPTIDIFKEDPTPEAVGVMPEALAREIKAIGFRLEGDRLTLACAEPISATELRQLSGFLEHEISGCVLADPVGLQRTMATSYGRAGQRPAAVGSGPAKVASVTPIGGASSSFAAAAEAAAAAAAAATGVGGGGPAPSLTNGAANLNGRPGLSGLAGPSGPSGPDRMRPDRVAGLGGGDVATGATDGDLHSLDQTLVDLDELLTYAVEHGASDLHLTNQLPPTIRIDGALRPIEGAERLNNEQIRELIYGVLTQGLRERFEAEKELDTSHTIRGVGRFRVNVFQQRGSIGAVLRSIPHEIPEFDTLGIPAVVKSFAELRRGLVLVTGPTGSGKSTTLASLIDIINRSRPLHLMTVEDPIEFLHSHQRAIVNQREVGSDTSSFAEALRHVLRQDPDVILVGELRDIETISTALTAAETGHLVFATLHTQDAPQTIDRIIDVFPTAQQDQIRIQLAGTLEGVVTQQLIISASGSGRVAVAEVMICTPAIRNLIRTAKTHQIYSLMQTGGALGMQTMDHGLARAVKARLISESVALDRCHDPAELRDHLKR